MDTNRKINTDTNNEENSSIDSFITRLDINLAELEKAGVILLLMGYSNFFIGANLEIEVALNEGYGELLPDEITLFGQELVFCGYIFLWIVAYNRVKEKSFRQNSSEEEYLLPAYESISNAYLLSVIANGLRVKSFNDIANFLKNNNPYG